MISLKARIGTLYTEDEALKVSGINPELFPDKVRHRTVLGLKDDKGNLVYPAFQFDESGAVAENISTIYDELLEGFNGEEWAVANWLAEPYDFDLSRTRIEVLRNPKDANRIILQAVRLHGILHEKKNQIRRTH